MAWLKKFLKKVVKSPVGKVMDTVTTAFVHPVASISAITSKKKLKKFKQVKAKHFKQSLSKQIGQTVLATVGYGAAVLGGAAIASKGVAATASSLVPTTLKGKAIAAIAAPVAIGAVASQPKKTLSAVASLPSGLTNVGANVTNLIADPSMKNVKTLISENPVLVGTAALAGGLVVGKGASALISGAATRRELKKQTAAIEAQGLVGGTAGVVTIPERQKIISTDTALPATPATQTITTGKARRRYRTRTKTPSMKQSVRVMVSNKAAGTGIRATKKYINERSLVN